MKETAKRRFEPPRRRLLAIFVWTVAIAWSAYLVWVDLDGDGGVFAVVVQIMGSLGILYALYLVTKPQKRGVLEILGVFREDVVPEGGHEGKEASSSAARWAIALLLLSLEGAMPVTSFSQHEVVRITRTIDASMGAVQQALARTPRFDARLPFYLKMGFPRPVVGYGSGLSVGDRRTIVFGNESPMEPMTTSHHHHPVRHMPPGIGGVLELRLVRSRDGLVVFKPVEDATAFTHWITWGRSVVRWKTIDDDSTEVTWTFHFQRRLSPSWYFGPFQRYAGQKAVGYLIDTIATP